MPAGQVLFTTFVGGAQYEAAATQPEDAQKAAVHAELSRFYGITGRAALAGALLLAAQHSAVRCAPSWRRTRPPTTLEAEHIVAVANWRAGVGVPDCIRHARRHGRSASG